MPTGVSQSMERRGCTHGMEVIRRAGAPDKPKEPEGVSGFGLFGYIRYNTLVPALVTDGTLIAVSDMED